MKKRLFAIFFLVLMVAMGIASVVGYLMMHVREREADSEIVPPVNSFVQQYYFEENETAEWATGGSDWLLDAIKSYTAKVKYMVSGATIYTGSAHPLSSFFSGTVSFLDRNDHKTIFLNGEHPFVRLPNGYFTYLYPYSHPVESWNSLWKFTDWLKSIDIKYLSLIAADKGDDDYAVFPENVPHGYSQMAKEYREFHREHGIEFLESRDRLVAHNSDFFSWFYKADHHWNVHAGLLMAQETAKRLLDMGIETDPSAADREKFSLTCYPNSFLGSMGRILGSAYNEDMEVYYPKGESSFHLQVPSLGIDRTGSFDNTLIVRQCLSDDNSSYGAFLYGDPPLVRIENLLADNSTRVLVIKQSKADVLCPYLAFTVRYLDMIDPRHFDGSISSFIEQNRPDIVITCMDVIYKSDEKFWRFK